MAKRQVPHWQCPRSQALSISSAAWRRLASRAGRSLRERILLQVSLYAIRAKKSRGGPGRPRTRTARRRRNSQIANDSLGFSAPERSKRKHTSLGHFLCIRLPQKKQVFQAHYDQRSAGHPIARFRDVSYALIFLLSTHGRDFLSQTAETTVPRLVQERQKQAKLPRAPNCRARGSEKARGAGYNQP